MKTSLRCWVHSRLRGGRPWEWRVTSVGWSRKVAGARETLENLLFQLSWVILCTARDTSTLGQDCFILLKKADVESLNTALPPLSFIKVKIQLTFMELVCIMLCLIFIKFHRVLPCNKLSFQCQCVAIQLDTRLPKSSHACLLSLASQDQNEIMIKIHVDF